MCSKKPAPLAYGHCLTRPQGAGWQPFTSGTVDVDRQGLLRQMDPVESFAQTARKIKITFAGFGLPVSVSLALASRTFCPAGRILITGTKPSGPPHPGRRVDSRRHPGQLKIFNGGGSIDDVLGGDLKAAACSPLVELGELVAGFPLVGGHTRPDGAPGGHKQTLRARQHITGRTRRSANRLA